MYQESFKGVSMKNEGCFNGGLSGFQGCLKKIQWGVARGSQGCVFEVLRVFQGSSKDVTRKFQGSLKGVSRKFQGYSKKEFRVLH